MKKALIIGTGSIAKKHINNLYQLKYAIYIFSNSKNKVKLNNKDIKLNYISSLKNLKNFDFAILANATFRHLNFLKILVKKKIHIYCEKPIFHKKFNFLKMKNEIKKNKIFFFTGYQLLQHENIIFLKKKLKNEKILSFNIEVGHDYKKWRSGNIDKTRYFLNKDKGGGVIFELIHEINLIQNLLGKIIYIKTLKKKSNKNYNLEDLAVSIIKTKKNIIGLLHQDMVSPIFYRSIKILTQRNLYYLDIANNIFKINKKKIKLNISDNFHQSLLKKNLINFIKLIDKNNKSLEYFEQSISDLKVALKMHKI